MISPGALRAPGVLCIPFVFSIKRHRNFPAVSPNAFACPDAFVATNAFIATNALGHAKLASVGMRYLDHRTCLAELTGKCILTRQAMNAFIATTAFVATNALGHTSVVTSS